LTMTPGKALQFRHRHPFLSCFRRGLLWTLSFTAWLVTVFLLVPGSSHAAGAGQTTPEAQKYPGKGAWEVDTMLDAVTQAQIWRVVLDNARERNLGILVVSHEESLILRLCGRTMDLGVKKQ